MAVNATIKGPVMILSGRMVGPNLDAVTVIGQKLLDLPEDQLTVDLADVEESIDIAGIQWLATIYRSARTRGKRLSFIGLSKPHKDALKISGFESLLENQ